MNGDKEMLNYIYENINMGKEALETLVKKLEKTDNKIRSHVLKSLDEYNNFLKKCNKLRKQFGCEPVKTDILATVMTKMGTNVEFMRDNSDTKIADTLIQGYNMGIIDITKNINKYEGDMSDATLKLAYEYKKMMEKGIKDIKAFL